MVKLFDIFSTYLFFMIVYLFSNLCFIKDFVIMSANWPMIKQILIEFNIS